MHAVFQRLFFALALAALLATGLLPGSAQPRTRSLQERLGYPADARLLIIHADDFGMSHSVDMAISQALEHGWVTSASVMVPCPWFPEVLRWARAHPNADLGLHLVLNSEWPGYRWGPVSPVDKVSSLLDPEGYFYNDPSLFTHLKMSEAASELHAQVDRARALGLHFSHLDSHMIALTGTRHLFALYRQAGRDYDLPIALVRNGSFRMPPGVSAGPNDLAIDAVVSMDPGIAPDKWFDWYRTSLSTLKPGIYQLIVHLAYDDPEFRARPRVIRTGALPGASAISTWSAARASNSSCAIRSSCS